MMGAALAGGAGALALPGLTGDAFAAVKEAQVAYPSHPKWRFVFVNHVTTNPFFVPTRYGAEDAGTMTGTTYQWTGSQTAKTPEMINAMNAAISGKADGIAVCIVDPKAFDAPTAKALKAGIPVVAYNADGSTANTRLAYIGQDLYNSGVAMGERIATLVPKGARIALFIATPGAVQHPAAHRRRAGRAQGQGLQDRRDHDGRRGARRALQDRCLLPGPQGRQGHVRGGRGLDPGRRARRCRSTSSRAR